jgi:Uri superfamily endonuclease
MEQKVFYKCGHGKMVKIPLKKGKTIQWSIDFLSASAEKRLCPDCQDISDSNYALDNALTTLKEFGCEDIEYFETRFSKIRNILNGQKCKKETTETA